MSVSRWCIVVLAMLSTAAAAATPVRYRLSILDSSVQKRFIVSLVSLDDRPLCLHIQKWPNRFGLLHYGRHWATLHTSKGIYPAYDLNAGRCVGPECIMHIAPHATITGFVSYEMFGHPAVIARLPDRRLELSVSPELCTAPWFRIHAMERTPGSFDSSPTMKFHPQPAATRSPASRRSSCSR
jgi:hypothetical protein